MSESASENLKNQLSFLRTSGTTVIDATRALTEDQTSDDWEVMQSLRKRSQYSGTRKSPERLTVIHPRTLRRLFAFIDSIEQAESNLADQLVTDD